MSDPRRASFAAGCFHDTEAVFRHLDGVLDTRVGYTGGDLPDPVYEQVATGTTGHAEAVEIVFDPAGISYGQLLEIFWKIIDPASADGQRDYTGPQYRSAIFCHDEEQKSAAIAFRDRIQAGLDAPVRTEILPATTFWPAEECHKQFYEKCRVSFCTSRQLDD